MTGMWSSRDCLYIETLFSKDPKRHVIQSLLVETLSHLKADTNKLNWVANIKIRFNFCHNIEELSLKNVTSNYHQLKQLDQPSHSLMTQIV